MACSNSNFQDHFDFLTQKCEAIEIKGYGGIYISPRPRHMYLIVSVRIRL